MLKTVEGAIPVGFIGLGRIASLLEDDPLREKPATHAGAVYANEQCLITGGYDIDVERRTTFAARWKTEAYNSVDELFSRGQPQIIVIATHPDSHFEYLRRAVGSDIPVVICEKPVAHRYRTAKKMAVLERRSTTRVVVNHERRFSRDYRLTREAVRDGRFGRLLTVQGRLFFGASGRHDHVFLHDGTHMVDAIHFLTGGRLILKKKIGRYRDNRSSVFLHGRTDTAVPVVIEVGAERRYLHFEIILSFEEGEISVGNGIFRWSTARSSPYYSSYRSLIDLGRKTPEPTGYFSGMVAEAVRLVRDPVAQSSSSLQDGLNAMRVIRDARRLGGFR